MGIGGAEPSHFGGKLDITLAILLNCICTCEVSILEQYLQSIHLLYLHFCEIASHLCLFWLLHAGTFELWVLSLLLWVLKGL